MHITHTKEYCVAVGCWVGWLYCTTYDLWSSKSMHSSIVTASNRHLRPARSLLGLANWRQPVKGHVSRYSLCTGIRCKYCNDYWCVLNMSQIYTLGWNASEGCSSWQKYHSPVDCCLNEKREMTHYMRMLIANLLCAYNLRITQIPLRINTPIYSYLLYNDVIHTYSHTAFITNTIAGTPVLDVMVVIVIFVEIRTIINGTPK